MPEVKTRTVPKTPPKVRTVYDVMLENVNVYKRCYYPFMRVFNVQLKQYWDGNLFGFDIIKFDEEFIKPPYGVSTFRAVYDRYGEDGLMIIYALLKMGKAQAGEEILAQLKEEAKLTSKSEEGV